MKYIRIIIIMLIAASLIGSCLKPPRAMKEETVNNILVKGNYTDADRDYFAGFFDEMQTAVNSKDAKKAFSFYSDDFMQMIFSKFLNRSYLQKNDSYQIKPIVS